jgi:hypothetical protein
MAQRLSGDQAVRMALPELSALRASGVLPDEFETTIASEGTVVYDLNGSRLYRTSSLARAGKQFATPTSP